MEHLYINGKHTVSVKRNETSKKVEKVFIDNSEKEFEPSDTQDKEQYAKQTQRNKYSSILNKQYENLVVLTGAGSSVGIGKSAIKGKLLGQLWDLVKEELTEEKLTKFCEIVKYTDKDDDGKYIKNLEKLLSIASAAKDFITDSKGVDIEDSIHKIEETILKNCCLELPDNGVHEKFLEKIVKRKVTLPRVKIFTLNYDTLFEQAGRKGNHTIIDGFSFSQPRVFSGRNFDLDVVIRAKSRLKEEDNFISRVFHLYKLHGSVDWEKSGERIFQKERASKPLMIYPKDSKYESSYEQPFFEMMSRFQQELRKENVVLLCIGFSMNDKHIVTVIKEALEQNPSFQLILVNRSIRTEGELKWLFELAKEKTNIALVSELFTDFVNHYPYLKSYTDANDQLLNVKGV